MSDTPRMDAAIDLCGDYEKPRQYAMRIERAGKKLERELNIALSQVEQLQAENARMREAIEDALPTLKSEEKHSSLITRTLQEAIASTDSSNWLAEHDAELEERIRVADAEEPVAWGVFGYFDSKWCLQFPVYSDKISASKSLIYTIFADGNNGDWKVKPLYLHAQIPAENARLREALLKIHNNGATWAGQTMARKALASTDSSNWLQERKAQWRREVLEEAAQWFDETDPWSYGDERTVRRNVQEELRRMAAEKRHSPSD